MLFDIRQYTNFLCVSGSHAYGTATETSDVDIQGFCSIPRNVLLSFYKNFEQNDQHYTLEEYPFKDYLLAWIKGNRVSANLDEPLDQCIFSLKKFFKLTADANPNMYTLAFADPSCVLYTDGVGELVRNNAHLFLSSRVRYSFSGYAVAQLKRIQLHRRHLLNPPDHDPLRKEFGLPERPVISRDQLQAAEALVEKLVREWLCAEANFDKEVVDTIRGTLTEFFAAYLNDKDAIENADTLAARYLGFSEDFITVLKKEKAYRRAKNEWKQYQERKTNRNPQRAEMEREFGYDCYSDDTEFLTKEGWKKFDDITEKDDLATLFINNTKCKMSHRKNFGIEYQKYTEKFSGIFTGNMYNIIGYHVDTLVTPNHRLLIRKVERKTQKEHEWGLVEAADLPDTFDTLSCPSPLKKVYEYNNLGIERIDLWTLMKIVGMFLSEGTISFRDGKPRSIIISQKKHGKMYNKILYLHKTLKELGISTALYHYKREKSSVRNFEITETRFHINDKELCEFIYKHCGHYKEKRIPRFVFSLSKRLMDTLLEYALAGDGTVRDTNYESEIYYSSVDNLANDIQELAFLCGYEASRYGPYEYDDNKSGRKHHINQIHINRNTKNYKRHIRNASVKKVPVENQRIVCFTVPNGILITRRNGHVGIHGNSKHGMHLVRLMTQCVEILTTGKVINKRPDAELLRSIRNGAWTYDQLMKFAEDKEKEIEDIYRNKKYVVPDQPDREALDSLYISLNTQFLKNG